MQRHHANGSGGRGEGEIKGGSGWMMSGRSPGTAAAAQRSHLGSVTAHRGPGNWDRGAHDGEVPRPWPLAEPRQNKADEVGGDLRHVEREASSRTSEGSTGSPSSDTTVDGSALGERLLAHLDGTTTLGAI